MEIEVGPLVDLPPGSAVAVEAGGREIAVFHTDQGLFAVDNRCAHRGGPLAEGRVADGIVTCPWHWWRYDLTTGRLRGSGTISLPTHPVTVRGGMVVVEAPEPVEEPRSVRDRLLEHARTWSREG